MNTYIAFDTETTGVLPGARLIELAAITFDDAGEIISKFERLVNPGMPIPPDATSVNSITNEMVKDMPDAGTVLNEFFAYLETHIMVGHYIQFDAGIISWEAGRFGIPIPAGLEVLCTCAMAKEFGVTKNNKLETLVDHYKLTPNGDLHRAMTDADLCRQYYLIIQPTMENEATAMNRVFKSLVPLPWDSAGHNYQYTGDFPDGLKNYPDMVANAAPITFRYVDARDAETKRTLIPNGWALQNGNLMINGWCQLRSATRTFRADRIVEVK